MTQVVIVGGGPGGYEAALVAKQLGADVTVVTREGLGGAAVLTDVVPSKGLIRVAEVLTRFRESSVLGLDTAAPVAADIVEVNSRLKRLAASQSDDIEARLVRDGITVIKGSGRLKSDSVVEITTDDGVSTVDADVILLATGAHPRELETARPDGRRILTWKMLYDLEVLPERLIVVGSGVTGAEFASAYQAFGCQVVLVSGYSQILPGRDADAARVIEDVFARRGVEVVGNSRAASVRATDDGVVVSLADGREIHGTHCLMAVGSIPNTGDIGCDAAGVQVDDRGFIVVDRVSRTSARGVYAAGDCTGGMMLASTAAMQGRIAMWHALGDAVSPLDPVTVSSAIFTDPEIAAVGVTQAQVDAGEVDAEVVLLPLRTNARAKMQELEDGFVKLFSMKSNRTVLGGVVVSPYASELIHVITLAVAHRLTVNDVAATFTVYPSLSGSIAEAARRLH